LVTTLRDDLAQCEHHIKELESILASKEDDLAVKVNHLTKQNMKLGRSMQAKQVFSEKLLKENKKLNEIADQQKGLMVVDRDVPDGQAIQDKINVSSKTIFRTGLV
jgi:DNA gyrase/topoisomerase IV subunit A